MNATAPLQALNLIRQRIIADTTLTDQQVWIGQVGALGFGGPAIVLTLQQDLPLGRVHRGATLEERRRLDVRLTAAGEVAIAQLDIAARSLAGGPEIADLAYHGEGQRRRYTLDNEGAILPFAALTQQWEHRASSPAPAWPQVDAVNVALDYGRDGGTLSEVDTITIDPEAP